MDKPNIDNFDRAVSLARKVIQEELDKELAVNCYVLEHYSATGVMFPSQRSSDHRIKLYEDNGEVNDGRIESEYVSDSYGASCNRRLASLALEVAVIFDSLRDQLAYELSQGYKISNLFIPFMVGVLSGSITRPKNGRTGNVRRQLALTAAMNVTYLFYGKDLKLTRNEATKSEKSILDAVSLAAKQLDYDCEYGTLKRDYYRFRRDYRSELPDILISEIDAIRQRSDEEFLKKYLI